MAVTSCAASWAFHLKFLASTLSAMAIFLRICAKCANENKAAASAEWPRCAVGSTQLECLVVRSWSYAVAACGALHTLLHVHHCCRSRIAPHFSNCVQVHAPQYRRPAQHHHRIQMRHTAITDLCPHRNLTIARCKQMANRLSQQGGARGDLEPNCNLFAVFVCQSCRLLL